MPKKDSLLLIYVGNNNVFLLLPKEGYIIETQGVSKEKIAF
jgi:hypothetical protein